jgi:hypothetical protein
VSGQRVSLPLDFVTMFPPLGPINNLKSKFYLFAYKKKAPQKFKRVFLMHKTSSLVNGSIGRFQKPTQAKPKPPLNFNRRRVTILTFGASVGQSSCIRKESLFSLVVQI